MFEDGLEEGRKLKTMKKAKTYQEKSV